MSETFEQRVAVSPAYDKRHANPAKNYGIGSMVIRFTLIGSRGAVHFVAMLGIYLPHVHEELCAKGSELPGKPCGYDIGYHSTTPRWEGHQERECDVLPGGKCYSDGTALGADEFLPEFIEGGSKAVWAMLEQRYANTFGVVEVAHD